MSFYYCVSRDDQVEIYNDSECLGQLPIHAVRILNEQRLPYQPAGQNWYILDHESILHEVTLNLTTLAITSRILELTIEQPIKDISTIMVPRHGPYAIAILDSSAHLHRLDYVDRAVSIIQLNDEDPSLRFLQSSGHHTVLASQNQVHVITPRSDPGPNDPDYIHSSHSISGVKSMIGYISHVVEFLYLGTVDGPISLNLTSGRVAPVECSILAPKTIINDDNLRHYIFSLDDREVICFGPHGGIPHRIASNHNSQEEDALRIPDDCVLKEIIKVYSLDDCLAAIISDNRDRLYMLGIKESALELTLINENVRLKSCLPAQVSGRMIKRAS